MDRLPDYDLYKMADIIVQAKRKESAKGLVYYDVILPNGARGYYGEIIFERLTTKVTDASNS